MAISQRELAAEIGTSNMTVSRALRGENGISEKTRRRVLDAARRAGLPLPPSPKALEKRGLLHVLCTVAPEPRPDSVFHGRLLDGLRRGARECAADIVNSPEQSERWPLIVTRRQVDGAIVVWGDEYNPMPHADCPVPTTFIFYGPPDADVVDADNFGGGYQLGVHLGSMGHRRVAFIGPDSRIGLERLAGLRAGLGIDGGDCPPKLTLTGRQVGIGEPDAVDRLLARVGHKAGAQLPFTALMGYNDFLAARAILRFRELGLRVPEDISVAGFDGAAPSWYDGPPLTTAAIPIEELGAEAARLVYWRIEHPNAIRRKLTLETELVKGETAAQAR